MRFLMTIGLSLAILAHCRVSFYSSVGEMPFSYVVTDLKDCIKIPEDNYRTVLMPVVCPDIMGFLLPKCNAQLRVVFKSTIFLLHLLLRK